MASVTKPHTNSPIVAQLHDDLRTVLENEKYGDVTIATIVGVLEFIKFNLINRSE